MGRESGCVVLLGGGLGRQAWSSLLSPSLHHMHIISAIFLTLCDHEAERWQGEDCFISGSKYCSGLCTQNKQGKGKRGRVCLWGRRRLLFGGAWIEGGRGKRARDKRKKVIKSSSVLPGHFLKLEKGRTRSPAPPPVSVSSRAQVAQHNDIQLRDWESEKEPERGKEEGGENSHGKKAPNGTATNGMPQRARRDPHPGKR